MALWIVSLVSLILISAISISRYRISSSEKMIAAAEADELADGLTNLVIASGYPGLGRANDLDSSTITCRISAKAIAIIAVDDEQMKIDLNTAAEKPIRDLFLALGATSDEAVKAVIGIHQARAGAEPGEGIEAGGQASSLSTVHSSFTSVMELDRIPGVSRSLFAAALPFFTTVPSRTAPPTAAEVFSSLHVKLADHTYSWPKPSPGSIPLERSSAWLQRAGVYLSHIEIATAKNAHSLREAVFAVTGDGRPAYILEWRKGRMRYDDAVRTDGSGISALSKASGYPPCWPVQ